jgi:hypothetical protein
MPRSMVGLLAAVGTAMSVLAASAHGDLVWLMIADASAATGLAAYMALLPTKKYLLAVMIRLHCVTEHCNARSSPRRDEMSPSS